MLLMWRSVCVPQGVSTHIKLKAAGELQDSGKREVYFEANGVPRVVEVVDKKSLEVLGKTAIREKVRRTGLYAEQADMIGQPWLGRWMLTGTLPSQRLRALLNVFHTRTHLA
jgi:pyruvate carboxylase